MRTSVILNLKGGVGKTITTINMASILVAEHHKRVLVIDADSQCSLTEFYGAEPKLGNLAEALRSRIVSGRFLIQSTQTKGLDILAGDDSLMDLDLSSIKGNVADSMAIRRILDDLAQSEQYDYVLIDCPPAFNAAGAAALVAADDAIIPIKLDAFSLRGMANVTRQIHNMQRINPKLRIAGFLPTMVYKDPQIRKAEQALRESSLHVFPGIRRSRAVDSSTFSREPLRVASPHSGAGIDYRKFVREYIGGYQHA